MIISWESIHTIKRSVILLHIFGRFFKHKITQFYVEQAINKQMESTDYTSDEYKAWKALRKAATSKQLTKHN